MVLFAERLFCFPVFPQEKIKYHDIFDQIPRYRYYTDIVVLTIGAFTTYLDNEIFDK